MTHISFGVHRSGRIIDAVEAERGLACECVCPVCGGELLARKGEVKVPHFAHHDSSNCAGAQMTALHLAAQQLLVDAQRFPLPQLVVAVTVPHACLGTYEHSGSFNCGSQWILADAKPEVAVGLGRRVDVAGVDPVMGRVAVEVRVTHEVDVEKAGDLASLGVPCVEVNLQELLGQPLTMEILAEHLFERVDNRFWVYHPQMADYGRDLMVGYPEWIAQREKEEADREAERVAWEAEIRRRQMEEAKRISARRLSLRRESEDAFRKAVKKLGLSGSSLPYYIDKVDQKRRPFAVEGRLWRTVLFAAWVHGRTTSPKADVPLPSSQEIAGMIAKRIGLSTDLGHSELVQATKAVQGYLKYLAACGVVQQRSGEYFVVSERPVSRPRPAEATNPARQAISPQWAPSWPPPLDLLDRAERFAQEHQLVSLDAALLVEELLPYQQQPNELSATDLWNLVEYCGGPGELAQTLFLSVGLLSEVTPRGAAQQ